MPRVPIALSPWEYSKTENYSMLLGWRSGEGKEVSKKLVEKYLAILVWSLRTTKGIFSNFTFLNGDILLSLH